VEWSPSQESRRSSEKKVLEFMGVLLSVVRGSLSIGSGRPSGAAASDLSAM
jgi:hypothetical protein